MNIVMKMNKISGDISIEEAAALMGIRPSALRVRMQRGLYPEIGFAVETESPISQYTNRKKYKYIVYRAGVEKLLAGLAAPSEK